MAFYVIVVIFVCFFFYMVSLLSKFHVIVFVSKVITNFANKKFEQKSRNP